MEKPKGGPPRGREKILLVENEDEVRRVIRRSLEKYGYSVLEAGNGGEALELWAQDFDLVITEAVMPGLSGPETVRRLSKRLGKVKALYVSGHADSVLIKKNMPLHNADFLQKPFDPEQLAAKVREILDRQ